MPLPEFNELGDLPPGVHLADLAEVLSSFGESTTARKIVGQRLLRVYNAAVGTGHLARFIIYGSFVTTEPEPNDVDVFLVMDEAFEIDQCDSTARILFDHHEADSHFGASVFWMMRPVFRGEQAAVEFWQTKRNLSLRGIVEIQGDHHDRK